MTPLRQRTLSTLLGACFVLCALSAQAVEAPDASLKSPAWLAPRPATKKPKPVAVGPSVGLGRSLAVLCLASLLGGTALYLRHKKQKAPQLRLAQLRVVGSTKLGGRAQLVLAEVEGRRILLGVTDSSVQKLGWLEDSAELEEGALGASLAPRLVPAGVDLAGRPARSSVAAEPAPPKRKFRDLLASAVGNIGNPGDDHDSAASTLAAETQDTFTRSPNRAADPRRAEPLRRAGAPQMIDLEGQAKGLLARLGDRRP